MKILIVTPATHFRSRGAAQHDIYGWIKNLRELGHEVALCTLDSPAQDPKCLQELRDNFRIKVVAFSPSSNLFNWIYDVAKRPALLDRSAHEFWQMARSNTFKQLINDFEPAAIVSFCSYSWPILVKARSEGKRAVLRSHNFEAGFFWESLNAFARFNPANWLRYASKYAGERIAVQTADAVATLPFEEVLLYKKWGSGKQIEIVTLAYLPDLLRSARLARPAQVVELFYLGASYNVIFHQRGVSRLIKDIIPRVRLLAPGRFRFHICGAKLQDKFIQEVGAPDCVYEGYVEDLDSFLNKMDAGVFPVMTGKTMKGKIFESLARAFPVVIPSIGKGGYSLTHNENVLIADDADEFAKQVVRLGDSVLREKLSRGAAEFSARELSAERVKNGVMAVLNNQ